MRPNVRAPIFLRHSVVEIASAYTLMLLILLTNY